MISDLSQRIEIRRVSLPEGFGFGEPSQIETSILTTWADVKEVSRASAVAQGLEVENLNYKIRIRYNSGREIKTDDFIIWQGNKYRAVTGGSVKELDKQKFIEAIIVRQNG